MGHEKNARGRYGELYIPSLTSLFLHLSITVQCLVPSMVLISSMENRPSPTTTTQISWLRQPVHIVGSWPTDPPAIARTMTYETLLGDRSP